MIRMRHNELWMGTFNFMRVETHWTDLHESGDPLPEEHHLISSDDRILSMGYKTGEEEEDKKKDGRCMYAYQLMDVTNRNNQLSSHVNY